jgi:hypothetical protein
MAAMESEVGELDTSFNLLRDRAIDWQTDTTSGHPAIYRSEKDYNHRPIVDGLQTIRSHEGGEELFVDPLHHTKAMLQAALYASISEHHNGLVSNEDHVTACWAWTRVFTSDHPLRALFAYLANRSLALRKYIRLTGTDRGTVTVGRYAIAQGYPLESAMDRALDACKHEAKEPTQAEAKEIFDAFDRAKFVHPAYTIISIIEWACERNGNMEDAENFLVRLRMRCIEYALDRIERMIVAAEGAADGSKAVLWILPFGDSPTDGYTGAMMHKELSAMERLVAQRAPGNNPLRVWPRVTVTANRGNWDIDHSISDRYANTSLEFTLCLDTFTHGDDDDPAYNAYGVIGTNPLCDAYGKLMLDTGAAAYLQDAATRQVVLALIIGFQHAWIDPVNNGNVHNPSLILEMWKGKQFVEEKNIVHRPMNEILLNVTPLHKLAGDGIVAQEKIADILESYGWYRYEMHARMHMHCVTHGVYQVAGVPQNTLTPQMGTDLPKLVTAWAENEERNGRHVNISSISSILKIDTGPAVGILVRPEPRQHVAPVSHETPKGRNAGSDPERDVGLGAPALPAERSWAALRERTQSHPEPLQIVDESEPDFADSSAPVQQGATWAEYTDEHRHLPTSHRMVSASKSSVAGSSAVAGSGAVDPSRLLWLSRDAAVYAAFCARATKEKAAAQEHDLAQEAGRALRQIRTEEATKAHLVGSAKSAKRARVTWKTARLHRKYRYSFDHHALYVESKKA